MTLAAGSPPRGASHNAWVYISPHTAKPSVPTAAGTYKIPTANDIPVDFRITLLHNAPNRRTPQVYSSKAVGEPPFFLGTSVFFALKEACYAARKDAGGWPSSSSSSSSSF